MKPKLSVITTVYNCEQFIVDSLESVKNQTFTDYEIILVDDGCTDNTLDILKKYKSILPNARLLKNKYNEGIPISRNRALLIAQGEYVAIHDGDDISLPDRFQKEIDYLDNHKNITFIGSYAYTMDHTGKINGTMVYPPINTELSFCAIKKFNLNPIIDPTSMYRKDIIINNGGYNLDPIIKTALDLDLWCRLLTKGHKMSNITEPLIKYRINNNGVTRTRNQEMIFATDVICSSFIKRSFKNPSLIPSFYNQDKFTEI